MFERYTETARRAVHFARYFAGRVGSPEIETEHLLLALLRADQGLGRRFLGSPWAAEGVWEKINQRKPIREKISGPVDLPLSGASKRVLGFVPEEADLLSNQRICTEHVLLGLLREEQCLAAEVLREFGVRLVEVREELMRTPHNDAAKEEFTRDRGPRPKDVAELQSHVRSIRNGVEEAIGNHDFATARVYSDEEGKERDKLFLLYRQYGLVDWIYD
jgi:ATP-dependent Clp protease ATP-binding subunit ClpC